LRTPEADRRRAVFVRVVAIVLALSLAICAGAALRERYESGAVSALEPGSLIARTAFAASNVEPLEPMEPAGDRAREVPARAADRIPTPIAERRLSKTVGTVPLRKALYALETGRDAEAVRYAREAAALDPGDAIAWLVLGAAHAQQGDAAAARASYASCMQKGRRGPVSECASLLRR
jgi:Flp pilus assembly protein TadD